MAVEFKSETNQRYADKNLKILDSLPGYIRDFYYYISGVNNELTLHAYLTDIRIFLNYEKDILKYESIKDIPVSVLHSLTPMDFNDYKLYLVNTSRVAKPTIRRYFASISALYNYWVVIGYVKTNPTQPIKRPEINSSNIIKLDPAEVRKLLDGIKSNNLYLCKNDDETLEPYIMPIPHPVKITREKLVLRNYAIVQLFLGSGIRISELVGLDMEDVNLKKRQIRVCRKNGAIERVYFDKATEDALRTYMYGSSYMPYYKEKYGENAFEIQQTIINNLNSPKLMELLSTKYGELKGIEQFIYEIARSGGRDVLLKRPSATKALFLSNRGKRMSVRMIEVMIKEMVATYIPECSDADKITPHKLRATCATRILSQTDNIALAQVQLGHRSSNTTSRYYAQVEEERKKKEISELDSTDW